MDKKRNGRVIIIVVVVLVIVVYIVIVMTIIVIIVEIIIVVIAGISSLLTMVPMHVLTSARIEYNGRNNDENENGDECDIPVIELLKGAHT